MSEKNYRLTDEEIKETGFGLPPTCKCTAEVHLEAARRVAAAEHQATIDDLIKKGWKSPGAPILIRKETVKHMGHFHVVRDWSIQLIDGTEIELDDDVLEIINKHNESETIFQTRVETAKEILEVIWGHLYEAQETRYVFDFSRREWEELKVKYLCD